MKDRLTLLAIRARFAFNDLTSRPERGASTVEWIFITVGVIVLAGIVYAVVRGFVESKAGELGS